MQPVSRVLPFALGLLCAPWRTAPAADALPGIFAPRAAVSPAVAETTGSGEGSWRRSATSERLWNLISQQAMAKAQAFDVSSLPVRRSTEKPAVVMEEYHVSAAKVRPIEVPVAESPMLRFVKTGRLFETPGGQFTGDLNLVIRPPVGALPKEPVVGAEIVFRFKW